jgi:hypothetical protein
MCDQCGTFGAEVVAVVAAGVASVGLEVCADCLRAGSQVWSLVLPVAPAARKAADAGEMTMSCEEE